MLKRIYAALFAAASTIEGDANAALDALRREGEALVADVNATTAKLAAQRLAWRELCALDDEATPKRARKPKQLN